MNFSQKILFGLFIFIFSSYNFTGAVQIDTSRIYLIGLDGVVIDNDGGMMSSPSEEHIEKWWFQIKGPNGNHLVGVGLEDDGRAYSYISDEHGNPLVGRPLATLRIVERPSINPNEKLPVLVCYRKHNKSAEDRFALKVTNHGKYALRLTQPKAPKYGINWEFVLEVDEDDYDCFDLTESDDNSSNGTEEEEVH